MLAKKTLIPSRPGAASRRKIVSALPVNVGWSPKKVAAFEKAFWEFVGHARINSKEKGGGYRIADGVYTGQKRFMRALWDGLAEDRHTIKCLKARQLGISTIVELLVTFWIGIFDGIQGGVVFDTGPHTAAARRRIKTLINNLPESYKFPKIVGDNRDGLTLANQSQLLFMSAGVRETASSGTLGRASGLNLLWGSELCSWQNTEGLTSLKNALSQTFPNRLYIEESTARSFNVWHDEWMEAKGNEIEETTFFAGWWAKDDQRISRGTQLWAVYGADPPSETELRRIAIVKERYKFDVDLEQLAWYRRYIDPTRERDDDEPDDIYAIQDQPWTEDEAFQQSGSPFFRSDKLTVAAHLSKSLKFRPYRFWPGDSIVNCDVQPAKTWKEVELKVWEDPAPESCYVVSGDPAFGRNEFNNNSCAQVMRCYADGLEQVAEFTSAVIEPHQFAWLLWTLVGWYGSAHQTEVTAICELNGSGEEVLRQYNMTRKMLRDGYLRDAARESGINNIFHNGKNYIYSRSDSMDSGKNWWWKALAVTEPLPTPTGWTTMGDVRRGDFLFDDKGVPCEVMMATDVQWGRECYCLTFDDKSTIIADAGHLWRTDETYGGVERARLIKTTELLDDNGEYTKPQFINVSQPIELPEVILPIHPYVLGVWLGDGHAKDGRFTVHQNDAGEIISYIRNAGYEIGDICDYKGNNICTIRISGLRMQLADAGLLRNKRIPPQYLRASYEQRMELLRGIMDIDGSIWAPKRRCEFSTTIPALADGFSELLRTLGIKPKFCMRHRKLKYKGKMSQCAPAWQFVFTSYQGIGIFRLSRKLIGEVGPRYLFTKRHKIVDVERVPSVPVKCIQVNSASHLYLAGRGMIPTHNTTSQLKVQMMDGLRGYFHNDMVTIRSYDALEEMKTIAREGDKIQAPSNKRDDRNSALAFAVRAWEERLRGGLARQNRTREADRIRRAGSPVDIMALFQKNLLEDMFKRKAAGRRMAQIAALQRPGFRMR